MKKIIIAIAILLVALLPLFAFRGNKEVKVVALPSDFKNATYNISGKDITLVNGLSEESISTSSAIKIVTKYFGNEIYKDLNDDGRDDVIFMLTQETGGSGVFYYVVASINTKDGYEGTEAIYIGDRIAPQNIISGEGKQVIVNYADRGPTEDFSVKPSFGKSLYLILDPVKNMFGEVVQDFEGESR
jgi:hypothetical protein